eukprot:CAMPEP_0170214372 /NCGR_PEP_ID=MMETSP0116_2-20130129/6817_1 /TAXON_ID=400756 /ORGANISM="Durinskia baltica, Strain CSIRO CS-38" /LENGTH=147 /DNA_ID=CAMNT_0010464937 /DNA_START=1028 /DNA_END=1467 /DNA_ORIENTATION=-
MKSASAEMSKHVICTPDYGRRRKAVHMQNHLRSELARFPVFSAGRAATTVAAPINDLRPHARRRWANSCASSRNDATRLGQLPRFGTGIVVSVRWSRRRRTHPLPEKNGPRLMWHHARGVPGGHERSATGTVPFDPHSRNKHICAST